MARSAISLLVAASLAVLLGLLGGLALDAGRPYPGFFATPDYYLVPDRARRARGRPARGRSAGRGGRRLPAHAGRARAGRRRARSATRSSAPGRRLTVELAPRPLDLEPAGRPLRGLLARLGHHAGRGRGGLRAEPGRRAQPALPPLYVPLGRLERGGARRRCWARARTRRPWSGCWPRSCPSTAGSSSSRTRPTPARERWLERHRVIPRLYRVAVVLGAGRARSRTC